MCMFNASVLKDALLNTSRKHEIKDHCFKYRVRHSHIPDLTRTLVEATSNKYLLIIIQHKVYFTHFRNQLHP